MHISSYFIKDIFLKALSIWIVQIVIYSIAYFVFNQQFTIIPAMVAGSGIAIFNIFRTQYNQKTALMLTPIITIISFALLWVFAMTITKLTSYCA